MTTANNFRPDRGNVKRSSREKSNTMNQLTSLRMTSLKAISRKHLPIWEPLVEVLMQSSRTLNTKICVKVNSIKTRKKNRRNQKKNLSQLILTITMLKRRSRESSRWYNKGPSRYGNSLNKGGDLRVVIAMIYKGAILTQERHQMTITMTG